MSQLKQNISSLVVVVVLCCPRLLFYRTYNS